MRLLWEDKSYVGANNAPISRSRQNEQNVAAKHFDTPSYKHNATTAEIHLRLGKYFAPLRRKL